MARKLTGARLQLGREISDELAAFCSVLLGDPPQIRIVRQAVRVFIKTQIAADRTLRERYEEALRLRRGGRTGDNVVVLPKGK